LTDYGALHIFKLGRASSPIKVRRMCPALLGKGIPMVQTPEDFQKLGKENVDMAMKSFGLWSKGAQSVAIEIAGYTKSSFELGTSTLEKLLGAKTLDQAVEIQQSYLKSSYEALVAEATKIGELYSDLAKEAYKPYEAAFAKAR